MESVAQSGCLPRGRCRKWRDCAFCAAVRQAQIANVAEIGAMDSRSITYAVIKPTGNSIGKQKAQVLKHLSKEIDGAIWTIETGSQVLGLHANLIIGSDKPIHAAQVASALSVESEVFAQRIPHTDIRKVAAYIAKPENQPRLESYAGRLYGSVGNWKTPLTTMVESNSGNGVMAALALEEMFTQAGVVDPEVIRPGIIKPPLSGGETQQERAIRAAHNKTEMERAAKVQSAENRVAAHHQYMKRVLAIHAGEIELEGFVYIDGYGLAGRSELVKFGLSDASV